MERKRRKIYRRMEGRKTRGTEWKEEGGKGEVGGRESK